MSNPLLAEFDLPSFDKIQASHFLPAIEQILAESEQAIDALCDLSESPSWDNFLYPLEQIGNRVERIWSPVSNLNAVCNTDEVREAHSACLPLLTDYSTKMGQHQGMFKRCTELKASAEYGKLDIAQKKMLDNMLRDFHLAGINLSDNDKKRYAKIKNELSELTTQFSNNVLDATQAWQKQFDDASQLDGLPASALESAQALAKSKNLDGYLVTLDIPSYLPVMQYCNNRELRKELYFAYTSRASEIGPNAGSFDNGNNMQSILALRSELAKLLGFDNYASLSIATKMANTTSEVVDFLESLASHSVSIAKDEYRSLADFAAKELGVKEMQAWDVAFASEKLRLEKYDLSQELLKPYFPADTVIGGMFKVVQRLYGIQVEPATPPSVWHEDVRFYAIKNNSGQLIAQFYLDLFAREGKRGGAWMADCQARQYLNDGSLQIPVAFLTCNFTPPAGDKPSLLTHNEVTTLFHEFGHGLHHMLTKIEVSSVGGISGVPWDAVELPSQFMENWCWDKESLALFSGHYETQQPLPDDLFEKMIAAKNFQSAMQMVRQIEFALFDFLIHKNSSSDNFIGIKETLERVREDVSPYPVPEENRFQNSFSHIFAGGYAAGYYSYKWAEVLSADAFSLFEETGIFNQETGDKFRRCILEKGGSEEPSALFEQFRGRSANTQALLRHSGIVANDAA